MILAELKCLVALRKHDMDKYKRLLEFYVKDRRLPEYYIEEAVEATELWMKTEEEAK